MLPSLNELVEQRIAQAQAEGAFDNLAGRGRPLDLREDPLVPDELRVANRVLKNAGMVPAAVAELNALGALRRALDEAESDDAATDKADPKRAQGLRRRWLAVSLSLQARGVKADQLVSGPYAGAIINRLTGS